MTQLALPDRYRIVRELGTGGAGVVFQALDAERGVPVAIKTMRSMSADALQRFKNEFRSLQGVRHPNLIALGELEASAGSWFFTMEYIDGVDFVQYVRPGPDPVEQDTVSFDARSPSLARGSPNDVASSTNAFDEVRLRDALAQLVHGLVALHAAGKVHRDIKPSNVLVTPGGRVVILDFGLVADVAHVAPEDAGRIIGTPAYMAPEQIAGAQVGPAADWYAAGVLLYKALTGRLPYTGSSEDVLHNKQRFEASLPAAPGVPGDLAQLCRDLVRRDPATRPTGAAILDRLGQERAALVTSAPAAPFVGRSRELAALCEALERARAGHSLAVLVEGTSGIGKTALVRELVDSVHGDARTLVLAGRCSQRESVPFKAVDGVVDALGSFLAASPDRARLLPADAGLLAGMFPVLRRIAEVAEAPATRLDGRELRARSFAALRELLARVAADRTVIVTIDDLQWTDADSLQLLVEVLRTPGAPPLLLVATLATELGDEVTVIDPDDVARTLPIEVRRLRLVELEPRDTQQLALQLATRLAGAPTHLDIAAVAAESRGHPLFTAELVRYLLDSPARAPGRLTLEQALRSRIGRLDPTAQRLLQIICVAHLPLTASAAARASGARPNELVDGLGLLGGAQLIRIGGMRAADRIEPYHSRIRAAVTGAMGSRDQVDHHLQIALALEAEPSDPAVLALHWHDAGQPEVAARHALTAADQAATALAFDRAARLYRWALAIGPAAVGDLGPIRRRLGEALASSGRGAEAAEAFLEAAAATPGPEAFDLERRALQQFLVGGHVEKGLAQLSHVTRELAISNPRGPRRLLASVLLGRARVRLRGLRFTARPADEITARERARIDTCCDAGVGLSPVDLLRGNHFQNLNLIYSLQSGDLRRITRAVMFEAILEASMGARGGRWQHLIDAGEELVRQVDTPVARAWLLIARGMSGTLLGRWKDAVDLLARARAILDDCPKQVVDDGVAPTYLLSTARAMTCGPLMFLGRLTEAARSTPALLREALDRDDVAAATHFRTGTQAIVWLSQGDIAVAQRHVDEAIAPWVGQSGQVPDFMDLQGRVTIDLYARDGAAALRKVRDGWPAFARTFLLRAQYVRITLLDLRGRAAIAAAQHASGRHRRELLDEARRCAARLERERVGWASAFALLLRAAIADDKAVRADFLERAARGADAADMVMHAVFARWARGLVARERGMIDRARAWAEAEQVVAPEQLAGVVFPGGTFD